jgi:hypothetical protein
LKTEHQPSVFVDNHNVEHLEFCSPGESCVSSAEDLSIPCAGTGGGVSLPDKIREYYDTQQFQSDIIRPTSSVVRCSNSPSNRYATGETDCGADRVTQLSTAGTCMISQSHDQQICCIPCQPAVSPGRDLDIRTSRKIMISSNLLNILRNTYPSSRVLRRALTLFPTLTVGRS